MGPSVPTKGFLQLRANMAMCCHTVTDTYPPPLSHPFC